MSTSRPSRNIKITFDPEQSQEDFEVEFFGLLLARSENNVDVLRRQAELMTRRDEHHKALGLDRRLVRLRPNDPGCHYNFSCSLAQTGDAESAIDALQHAITLGYDDFPQIEIDADLDSLRDHPRYIALMREHGWPQ